MTEPAFQALAEPTDVVVVLSVGNDPPVWATAVITVLFVTVKAGFVPALQPLADPIDTVVGVTPPPVIEAPLSTDAVVDVTAERALPKSNVSPLTVPIEVVVPETDFKTVAVVELIEGDVYVTPDTTVAFVTVNAGKVPALQLLADPTEIVVGLNVGNAPPVIVAPLITVTGSTCNDGAVPAVTLTFVTTVGVSVVNEGTVDAVPALQEFILEVVTEDVVRETSGLLTVPAG